MGLPSEHSNNTAFEHHFLIAYFCLHNQSSNKKNEPIGIGDRGGRGQGFLDIRGCEGSFYV